MTRPSKTRALVLICTLCALTACGGSDSDSGSSQQPEAAAADETAVTEATPSTETVETGSTESTDADGFAAAVGIELEGGATLELPAGSPTDVTAATTDGRLDSPIDGFARIASYTFGPSGTMFDEPATLTIPVDEPELGQVASFLFLLESDDGTLESLPVRHDGSTATIEIPHFSEGTLFGSGSETLEVVFTSDEYLDNGLENPFRIKPHFVQIAENEGIDFTREEYSGMLHDIGLFGDGLELVSDDPTNVRVFCNTAGFGVLRMTATSLHPDENLIVSSRLVINIECIAPSGPTEISVTEPVYDDSELFEYALSAYLNDNDTFTYQIGADALNDASYVGIEGIGVGDDGEEYFTECGARPDEGIVLCMTYDNLTAATLVGRVEYPLDSAVNDDGSIDIITQFRSVDGQIIVVPYETDPSCGLCLENPPNVTMTEIWATRIDQDNNWETGATNLSFLSLAW